MKMGDGTKEGPYTRKDVLRMIEENGGTAKGLDLSGHIFEDAVDLSCLNLNGIILKGSRFPTHFENSQLVGAKFNGSELIGSDLSETNFQYAQFKKFNDQPTCLAIADLRGSSFLNASFQYADLTSAKFGAEEGMHVIPAMLDNTDFRGANLFQTNFKECFFDGTKFEGAFVRGSNILEAHLEEVNWGSYIIGEEHKKEELYFAENTYRRLKIWYTNAGMYEIAGKFFYREMEAKRKSRSWKREPSSNLWFWIIRLLCGYGERYGNVVVSALAIIFGLAIVYIFGGLDLAYAIYFSVVSFTALGYGSWAHTPAGWIKGLGAAESFLGVFMMALFLVTFTRKMTR